MQTQTKLNYNNQARLKHKVQYLTKLNSSYFIPTK